MSQAIPQSLVARFRPLKHLVQFQSELFCVTIVPLLVSNIVLDTLIEGIGIFPGCQDPLC